LSGVFDEQLAHLYAAAGVLVTPSHYEASAFRRWKRSTAAAR
jgi:hypothetical protein